MRYYYNTYDPVWGLNNIVNDLFDTWSDNGRRFPPVDVYETDNAYVIEMEVAGYDEEKISMHVEKHILSVKSDEVKSDEKSDHYSGFVQRHAECQADLQKPEGKGTSAVSGV